MTQALVSVALFELCILSEREKFVSLSRKRLVGHRQRRESEETERPLMLLSDV
jgi:hypothetical protein